MSLFPVKVWIDSDVKALGLPGQLERNMPFEHLHEKLYYVEARMESQAEEEALEVYMREELKKHLHAHTDGSVIVEHAPK